MSIISSLVACVFAMYLYCSRNVVFLPTNVDVRAQEAEAPRVSELGSLFRSTNRPLPPVGPTFVPTSTSFDLCNGDENA